MIPHETWIEKFIRENTPDFVVGTSWLLETYCSSEIVPIINFGEKKVLKHFDSNGNIIENSHAIPDIILLDKSQLDKLRSTIEDLTVGRKVICPIGVSNGWFIECFGKFWHSEKVVGLSKEEHERNVQEAYESIGCHVLILWEEEIEHFWEESARPKLQNFMEEFLRNHKIDWKYDFPKIEEMRKEHIQILCCPKSYIELSEDSKMKTCRSMVECMTSYEPYRYDSTIELDRKMFFKKKAEAVEHGFKQCFTGTSGEILRRHFMRQSLFRRRLNGMSVMDVWRNHGIMEKSLDECLRRQSAPCDLGNVLSNALRTQEVPRVIRHWKMAYRLFKHVRSGNTILDPFPQTGVGLLTAFLLDLNYIGVAEDSKEVYELADFIGLNGIVVCNSFEEVPKNIDVVFISSPMWEDMEIDSMVQECVDCLKEGGLLMVEETPDLHPESWKNVLGHDEYLSLNKDVVFSFQNIK